MNQHPELKIGDKLVAKDGSGYFIVKKFTKIGAIGEMEMANGEITEGYATYAQLENDWVNAD